MDIPDIAEIYIDGEITAYDIGHGYRSSSEACPWALAVARALGSDLRAMVSVLAKGTLVQIQQFRLYFVHTPDLQSWIAGYDNYYVQQPASFRMRLTSVYDR